MRSFDGDRPRVHAEAFVHDSAELLGRVVIGARASIWPGCVLRGDIDRIVVGPGSNIQDLSVIHTRKGRPSIIGRNVTVGHRAILHGCRIGDRTLVGMGAIVMEATIGAGCIIGAGALVPAGSRIPPGVLAFGTPAKVVRKLLAGELRMLEESAREYRALALRHARTSRVLFGD